MRTKLDMLIGLALLIWPAVASAASPDGTWRVVAMQSNPSGDFSGDIVGIPTTIEADSASGLGTSYEVRTSDLLGWELGMSFTDFDFGLSVPGGSGDFGSALMIPFTFGLNVHVARNDRIDFYVGPVAAYTLWGNLDTDVGETELDRELGFGANLGLDVALGWSKWGLCLGAAYLQAAAADSSLEIDVDPLSFRFGLARNF